MCYKVLIYTVDDVTKFDIYLPSTSKAMANREKEGGNTKIWISWERKELFTEIKSIFHIFWRAIIWWEIKIW